MRKKSFIFEKEVMSKVLVRFLPLPTLTASPIPLGVGTDTSGPQTLSSQEWGSLSLFTAFWVGQLY
jgi:hypothetical protein